MVVRQFLWKRRTLIYQRPFWAKHLINHKPTLFSFHKNCWTTKLIGNRVKLVYTVSI